MHAYTCGKSLWSQSQSQWRYRHALFGVLLLFIGLSYHVASATSPTGPLTSLSIANLSPTFSPEIMQYSIPQTTACSIPVVATLANPTLHKLFINSTETASGATRSAWLCDGQTAISIVVYAGWTEVGRYTVTPGATLPPPPPPPATPPPETPTSPTGPLSSLTIADLSPSFTPEVTQYSIPQTTACSIPVVATLANPALHKLFINSTETASGATRSAWLCDGQTAISIVVYAGWTEVGRYTVTPGGILPPPPPPPATPPPETPPPPPATTPPPAPTPGVVDAISATRFLEQATFGPTSTDIAAVQQLGLSAWLAQQFELPESPMPDDLEINQVRSQLFLNMANGADQLRQRMMFALSQTLVVSTSKNVNGEELIPWVRLLSQHAFGNFRTLLKEVTLSPSMGKYLDLANSMMASPSSEPNENFPRELLQLFSIGLVELHQDGSPQVDAQGQPIPTYTQHTVREFARALTGWTYPTMPGEAPRSQNPEYFVGFMEPRPAAHDTGAKTLLNGVVLPAGQSVEQDLEDVIDNVFEHANVPPFIATRLIRSLVTSNPSPGYIERVADVFVDNGAGVRGDLWAVLRAILTDTEATAPPTPHHGHLKDPVLHIIGLGRSLGAQITDPTMFLYVFASLGQQVLSPATVFSFYSPLGPLPGSPELYGPEFQLYTPALAIQRANFIYGILSGQFGSAFSVNLAPFIALANDPVALVEHVNQTVIQGRMSAALRQIVLTATNATTDANQRALGAVYLTAIASEYAVQR